MRVLFSVCLFSFIAMELFSLPLQHLQHTMGRKLPILVRKFQKVALQLSNDARQSNVPNQTNMYENRSVLLENVAKELRQRITFLENNIAQDALIFEVSIVSDNCRWSDVMSGHVRRSFLS